MLVAVTLAVYGRTLGDEFVNCDDGTNVYENPAVINGLTETGLREAFTKPCNGNWAPLTVISHMLDCQLFGLRAGGHHFTNVLLHTASVLLLFLVLRQMTGAVWPSAFVAAVFAVHPLHVESVAWVSERKDVLSGLFFMLTLWAYVKYVSELKVRPPLFQGKSGAAAQSSKFKAHYALTLVFFALGLMSKAMLVTMPFVLLLLDYWPLGRSPRPKVQNPKSEPQENAVPWSRLVMEKLPLCVLSAAACFAAYAAQGGSVQSLVVIPTGLRLENALVSCAVYIGEMFAPAGLAAFYPYPINGLPTGAILVAAAVVGGVTVAVLRWRRSAPYVLVGWLWYLVMLVPVIGLVQVGGQSRADRYTYLPQIGLYIALVWLAVSLVRGWKYRGVVLSSVAVVVVAALGAATYAQAGYWHDSVKLWEHTLACVPRNGVACNNLGAIALQEGRTDEALSYFERAAEFWPDSGDVFCNLGTTLLRERRVDEAIAAYQRAIGLEPGKAVYYGDLGTAMLQEGRLDDAVANFEKSLALQPGNVDVINNLGVVLFHEGRFDEAIAQIINVLRSKPHDRVAQRNLAGIAWVLAASPDTSARNGAKAVELAQTADRLADGGDAAIASVLAGAYAEAGRYPEAVSTAQRAMQLATTQTNAPLAGAIREQLENYQAGRPWRDASANIAPRPGTGN